MRTNPHIAPTCYCTGPRPRPERLSLGRNARRIVEYACAFLGRKSRPCRTLGPFCYARWCNIRTKRGSGFSLIELLIVLAIVATVLVFALPVYTRQVAKTHRVEGKSALIQMALALERCYTRYAAYNDPACTTYVELTGDGIASENGHYRLSFATPATETAFTVQAAPQAGHAERDRWCGTFVLTHTGQKDMINTPAGGWDSERCWN